MIDNDNSKGKWYVIHAMSGRENTVREKIESQIQKADAVLPVYQVLIPKEKFVEVRNGVKKDRDRQIFPGYVYIRMDLVRPDGTLDSDVWNFINGIDGVMTILGAEHGRLPIALSDDEVENLLRQTEKVADKGPVLAKVPPYISIGATVRIIDGAFANFEGVIEEIDPENGRLKLLVSIFGRSTPVELEFWQVGPDEE